MTQNKIDSSLNKLNLVLEDFQMLRDGTWIPDTKSINDSMENIQDVIYIIENE